MIRKGQISDIENIMRFIDENWKKNHILATDREIFEFQYVWRDEVCFVLSIDNQGNIEAILGFIPYGPEKRDITLAVWKALSGSGDVLLGVRLLEFLMNDDSIRSISCPGINPKTRTIYEFLGFKTGKMGHWYRLSERAGYVVGKIVDATKPPFYSEQTINVTKIKDISDAIDFCVVDLVRCDRKPEKTISYIERRYFSHPSYQYGVYGLQYEDKKLIFVVRAQECNGTTVLRHIDNIGDEEIIGYAGNFIDNLLVQYGAEYIDMYETGVDAEFLKMGGWLEVNDTRNIIPEYFSPFEQKNIDIYYCSQLENVILYKGDGDMDRPN